jgi:RecA-family ATPase
MSTYRAYDFEPEDQSDGGAPSAPLPFLNIGKWDAEPAPPREWAVPDRIPLKQPTLLSGEGAAGKSLLLLQLTVTTALGREWLGVETIMGPTIYFGCEDDADELHRRLDAILKHHNVEFHHLAFRGFRLLSFAGQDAVLGATNKSGRVEPTALFHRLYREACEIRPRVLALDTASDIFAGKENDRSEVRQFMSLLRKLAIDASCAVVLASHPSLTGITSGTGTSGSTQWHNSVRARMYLKAAREGKNGDDGADNGLRELEFKKNQYGRLGHRILLRWEDGLFVPVSSDAVTIEQVLANDAVDDLFLTLLRRFTEQGRNVSPSPCSTSAAVLFADQPEANQRKLSRGLFAASQERLLATGKLKVVTEGPPSRRRDKLVEPSDPPSNPPSNCLPTASNCLSQHTPLIPPTRLEGSEEGLEAPDLPTGIGGEQPSGKKLPAEAKVRGMAPGQKCQLCGSGRDVFLIQRRKGEAADPVHKDCAARAWGQP